MSKYIESLTSIRDYLQDRIELEKDPLFDKEQAKTDVEALNIAIKALSEFPYVKYTENGMEPDFEMANAFFNFDAPMVANANQHNSNTSHDDGQHTNALEGDAVSRKKVLNQIFYSTDNNGDVVLGSVLRHRIENLPSVNPVPCEDAISRQAVLDYIRDNYRRWFINDDAFMQCVSGIKNIVPVAPQPKTGEWQQDLDGTFLCSECGSGFKEQPTLMGKPMFLWCPLCGARMAEPQEKQCADCNHYGKLSLDCGRCDDDCSMYEPQEVSGKE